MTSEPGRLPPAGPIRKSFGFGHIAFWIIVVALLALFTVRAAPIVLAAAACILIYRLIVRHDVAPYTYSRSACALLIAWAVDGLLHRTAVDALPGSFTHFVPAIVVVSAFVAFFAWRELPKQPIKREQWFIREKLVAQAKAKGTPGNPLITLSHPFAVYLSLLLMLFTMDYAIMPVLGGFFPRYSSYWTDLLSTTGNALEASDHERP